eukprot:2507603-Prymnesium_polylepis.1
MIAHSPPSRLPFSSEQPDGARAHPSSPPSRAGKGGGVPPGYHTCHSHWTENAKALGLVAHSPFLHTFCSRGHLPRCPSRLSRSHREGGCEGGTLATLARLSSLQRLTPNPNPNPNPNP